MGYCTGKVGGAASVLLPNMSAFSMNAVKFANAHGAEVKAIPSSALASHVLRQGHLPLGRAHHRSTFMTRGEPHGGYGEDETSKTLPASAGNC